jgi:deazaflavin-dependent oxidoreductase (nitroreductase family)
VTIELPPSGTRGVEIPQAVRPLIRAMSWTGSLMFRLGVKIQGRPLVRLTTVGARTGKTRHTVLGSFPDQDRPESILVVASNAGSARHPGWAHNLAKEPDSAMIETGDGDQRVDVEIMTGPDRESAWARVVEMAPGYGSYVEKTDRQIPIFRLTPRR